MSAAERDLQAEAEAVLAGLADGLEPLEAAQVLAVLISRASTRLYNLGRREAGVRKDQPDWPPWAQLQNAARTLVLQASTCRDLAAKLVARKA